MFTLVIFPGFSPELWAERAPEQDSCRVPHRRAHTNKSHCLCAGGCGNAVTLLPFPPSTITMIIIISFFIFIPHSFEFATEWMSCPFLLIQIQQMLLSCSPPHSTHFLLWQRLWEIIFFTANFSENTAPSHKSSFHVCAIWESDPSQSCGRVSLSHRNTPGYLSHYHLLKEVLCSLNQICWPASMSWST